MKPLTCDTPTDICVHFQGQDAYWICEDHLAATVAEMVRSDVAFEIRKLGARAKGQVSLSKDFKWKCQTIIEPPNFLA